MANELIIKNGLTSKGQTSLEGGLTATTISATTYQNLPSSDLTVTEYTASTTTLSLSDSGKLLQLNNASANDLEVPLNSAVAFPIGTQILIMQYGAGQTTVISSGGVTLRSSGGKTKLAAQYAMGSLIKIDTDEWVLAGDITT
jgi:hypothetical protein